MNYAKPMAAFAFAAFAATSVAAQDQGPTAIVTGGATTIIYVFATSPQTFVPVAGLPSFLVMPGADLPAVATQVVYTTPAPALPAQFVARIDVDCTNFTGVVTISGPDRFKLDKDGDGIGCEPEDR